MADLDALSLRQLRSLLVILEEGNVSRAARRLGVSQPALSQTLRLVREAVGDPLLIPGARGLVRTPRADSILEPLRRHLVDLDRTLSGAAFDPATTRRTFTLGMGDAGALTLLPPLLTVLRDEAPRVDLDVRPASADSTDLEAGLDVTFLVRPPPVPAFRARRLFDDRFVCVVRRDHPQVGATLDLETFLALPHILISPQGEGPGVVDLALAAVGRERRVALRIRYFLAAPFVIAASDMVLTLPESLARTFAATHGLRVLEPPVELAPFATHLVWHERYEDDPGHRWLREAVVKAARKVASRGVG